VQQRALVSIPYKSQLIATSSCLKAPRVPHMNDFTCQDIWTRGGGHDIHAEKLATPTARPPRRWRDRAATGPLRGTCGSRRSRSHPAATAMAMRARGPSGSWSATTPNKPTGTRSSVAA